MSFIKTVVEGNMDIWNEYLEHPFIKGLQSGDLEENLMKKYIIEDSIYLREYARVFALAIYKSKSISMMKCFHELLTASLCNETCTRERYLKKYGLPEEYVDEWVPSEESKAYTAFMLEIADRLDIPEILMAVLPCMLSYCYIGCEIVKRSPNAITTNPYADLIQDYSNDAYRKECVRWAEFADQLCDGLDEARKSELFTIFREASIHEMHFWDMSYRNDFIF